MGAEVLRTDNHGTVVLSSDGATISVEVAPQIALVPTGIVVPPSEPKEAAAENAVAAPAPAPPPATTLPATGDPAQPSGFNPGA